APQRETRSAAAPRTTPPCVTEHAPQPGAPHPYREAGPAVAAQVWGNGPQAGFTQGFELRAPGLGAFRKAMQQQRKLPGLRSGGQAAKVETVGCDSYFSHLTDVSSQTRWRRPGQPTSTPPCRNLQGRG